MRPRIRIGAGLLALVVAIAATWARAQETIPSTTNPAQRIVYPGDQSPEAVMGQQLACHKWSSERTSWNPEAAYAQLKQDHGQAMAQFEATQGSAVRGAAGGALVGLAIGAIAGDAGTGAAIGAVSGGAAGGVRGRRGRAAAEQQFEAAVAEFQTAFRLWDRHWVACMIGNGYGVG